MWITDLVYLPWNSCIKRKILKGLVAVQIIARIVPSSISKTTVYTFGFVYDWIIGIGMRRRLVGSTSAKTHLYYTIWILRQVFALHKSSHLPITKLSQCILRLIKGFTAKSFEKYFNHIRSGCKCFFLGKIWYIGTTNLQPKLLPKFSDYLTSDESSD